MELELDELIKAWSLFDRKVVLYFTGNKESRVPGMDRELDRVGLYDACRQWQFPSPVEKAILRNVQHTRHIESVGYMNCTMGHYRAIASSYHMGCKSVLIMEDDARFLNDASEICMALKDLPEDYDLAMLDWFYSSWSQVGAQVADRFRKERSINDHWAEFDKFHSGACYALSRSGMERILPLYEKSVTDRNVGKLRICDGYLDRRFLGGDCKMYFAKKNIAIQRQFGESNSNGAGISNPYLRTGIDVSNYAEA